MSTSTKDIILRALGAHGKCSVNQLAGAAAISRVSVRHHLASLQAENLVVAKAVRHGLGSAVARSDPHAAQWNPSGHRDAKR